MKDSFWLQKNVFITGASGLLGSWLSTKFVELGANITILMRDHIPNSLLVSSSKLNAVNVVHGGLEDYFVIERALNEYEIDSVFHLGAQTIVGTANRSPLSTFESNIKGTWNVMEACRNSQLVKRIVFASSDKAYGDQEKLPYTEETPLQGRHPYDASKSCSDLIVQSYYHTYGLPVSIARCGNIYGPGDLNFNRLIPGTIRSVVFNERPTIRSDGTYIRDYLFVEDVVDAYLCIGEKIGDKKVNGQAFNISTENKFRVLDIVNLVLKKMKSTLKPEILNHAKGEIKNQYLSTEKAKKILNWESRYSIDEGLDKTIPWYIKYLKRS
ncbi:MAG TPA: GDP-mannose 4,6-dehydratase [Candidatus Bilamarchaeaceae archaeon]|nr:GDP-mannose 4,6-dehydratase [Candidatus Bilamarchaeaceae archaeon]